MPRVGIHRLQGVPAALHVLLIPTSPHLAKPPAQNALVGRLQLPVLIPVLIVLPGHIRYQGSVSPVKWASMAMARGHLAKIVLQANILELALSRAYYAQGVSLLQDPSRRPVRIAERANTLELVLLVVPRAPQVSISPTAVERGVSNVLRAPICPLLSSTDQPVWIALQASIKIPQVRRHARSVPMATSLPLQALTSVMHVLQARSRPFRRRVARSVLRGNILTQARNPAVRALQVRLLLTIESHV